MGILRKFREWREDKDGTLIGPDIQADSVDAGSVKAGSLTDTDDGQAWETLREIGYEKGDVLELAAFNQVSSRSVSTTSTTYTADTELFSSRLTWNKIVPDGTLMVRLDASITPGADETADVRVRNLTNNETLTEILDVTSGGGNSSEWTEYTPDNPTNTELTVIEHRTDPGTNAVQTKDLSIHFGVQL